MNLQVNQVIFGISIYTKDITENNSLSEFEKSNSFCLYLPDIFKKKINVTCYISEYKITRITKTHISLKPVDIISTNLNKQKIYLPIEDIERCIFTTKEDALFVKDEYFKLIKEDLNYTGKKKNKFKRLTL